MSPAIDTPENYKIIMVSTMRAYGKLFGLFDYNLSLKAVWENSL